MENTNLMLFICLSAPLSMMLFVFKGRSRAILGFLLTGIFMCLFAGEINGFIRSHTELSIWFLTVNITPIVEEILKAFPIILIAFLLKPDRQLLLECAIAVGVGFATLENICLLFDSAAALSAGMIVARGFGAGMMHGVSTLAVGYSMTIASSTKKLSLTGTVSALSAAIIYHSIYNIIAQSRYPTLSVLLPIVTYIPLLIVVRQQKISRGRSSAVPEGREADSHM